MNPQTPRRLMISVQMAHSPLGPPHTHTATRASNLLETVEKLSRGIPPELQVRVDPEGRSSSDAKMGLAEINAILVTLGVATTAAKPIFDFVVNLAREKKCRMKITRRWIAPNGIEEQEAVLEGSGNNSHVTALIEEAIKQVRRESIRRDAIANLPKIASDIDVIIYPIEPDGDRQ